MIAAVGISNLQYADMNSGRNLFIFGFSFFFGLSMGEWMGENSDSIKTGKKDGQVSNVYNDDNSNRCLCKDVTLLLVYQLENGWETGKRGHFDYSYIFEHIAWVKTNSISNRLF